MPEVERAILAVPSAVWPPAPGRGPSVLARIHTSSWDWGVLLSNSPKITSEKEVMYWLFSLLSLDYVTVLIFLFGFGNYFFSLHKSNIQESCLAVPITV